MSLLAACAGVPPSAPGRAATQGDTSYRAERGDLAHYELALGQVSSGAVPREHPAPAYPAALLQARLPPIEVGAHLIVDAQGRVIDVRIPSGGRDDANRRQFEAAVRAAAMAWTFDPLVVTQWAADANGNSHVVSSEARPFSLDYVFRFACKDGRPVTNVNPITSGRQP